MIRSFEFDPDPGAHFFAAHYTRGTMRCASLNRMMH
jgi:hypothetical protein